MGETTKISWCHHTLNPWWGCTKVSAGCANCYAEAWAKRTGHDVFGQNKPRRFFGDKYWNEPIGWDANAAAAGQRRRVFCGSMCDVFESDAIEPSGADECDYARDALWHLIEGTPRLDWLLLTKRPENIEAMVPSEWYNPEYVKSMCAAMSRKAGEEIVPDRPLGWPRNVWAMATIENHEVAASRLDALLKVPAMIRGVSMEPLLGPALLPRRVLGCRICGRSDVETALDPCADCPGGINWLIVGCEKLPGGRPGRRCELAWVRDLVAQARAAGVAVFVKQLEVAGRVSANPADWPEDLRIQEFPNAIRR